MILYDLSYSCRNYVLTLSYDNPKLAASKKMLKSTKKTSAISCENKCCISRNAKNQNKTTARQFPST